MLVGTLLWTLILRGISIEFRSHVPDRMWRALWDGVFALPEAREGRELRFLFLPDGEDPDSLVGAEGQEAFESRFAHALPLSEYLVQQLMAQTDLSSADGRAKLAALAKPLFARLPDGVLKELIVDQLAAFQFPPLTVDGLAASRQEREAMFLAATADEIFITSTSLCICPAASLNGAPVLNPAIPGPITRRLQNAFSDLVGVDVVAQYLAHMVDPVAIDA